MKQNEFELARQAAQEDAERGPTPVCVRLTGGLPDDPCWCGACGEDEDELDAES